MDVFKKECGPNATDNYTIRQYSKSISHTITGIGKVTMCKAYKSISESYTVEDGITELGDGCFSFASIKRIALPQTLLTIGNNCFAKSNITTIILPDSLKEIGESNFPSSLTQITIPPLISYFPISNIRTCKNLISVGVHEENTNYKSIDGVLYNYDLTEIIFCPPEKSGVIYIPSTVVNIGDYCFENCNKLTKIIIPSSVETIGQYAFSKVELEKLIIPDSVRLIGEGCFYESEISNKFYLSDKIVNIPNYCFEYAKIPICRYLKKWETIGKEAFSIRPKRSSLSGTISLLNAKRIGERSFASNKNITIIELYSQIQSIDSYAFIDLDSPIVKLFSYAPIKLDTNAFATMGKATLMVPSNTKFIFENVEPWSSFSKIVEMDLDKDIDGDEVKEVSSQTYLEHLKSVDYSLNNPNRLYLKEIIETLYYEYMYVDSDEEYEKAICLIDYNKAFRPPIIPNLEQQICHKWEDKYKLKLLDKFMMEGILDMQTIVTDKNLLNNIDRPSVALPINIDKGFDHFPEVIEEKNITIHFSNILTNIQNELSKAEEKIKDFCIFFTAHP